MNTPQFIIDELNAGMDGFTPTSVAMPEISDRVLVKLRSGEPSVFYAVYSNENEFDVHMPKSKRYRKEWYKFSKTTVKSWHRVL